MDNRRLDSLIRMAAEIEEIERSAGNNAGLRLVHSAGSSRADRRRRAAPVWALRLGAFAAAAASVALAFYFTAAPAGNPATGGAGGNSLVAVEPPGTADSEPRKLASTGVPLSTRTPPLLAHTRPATHSAGGEPVRLTPERAREIIRSMEQPGLSELATGVLAIFEDDEGVVRCVRWLPNNFGGRQIDKLEPGELVSAIYGPHCSVIGPHRLIAVAVTGPRENLPDCDERAQALAQCIVGDAASVCETDPAPFSATGRGCIPKGLKVMVETLAMGKS